MPEAGAIHSINGVHALIFGWAKTVGGMAQTMYRGVERVRSRFILTIAANNLARLPRLLAA